MAVLARGLSWKGLAQVVGELSWYGALVILAGLLAPSAFGTVAVALVLVAVTRLLMESGTGGGIIVSQSLTGTDLRALLLRNLMISSSVTAGLMLLAPVIVDTFAEGSNPAVLRVMLLSVMLAAVGIVPTALLDKTLRFKARSRLTIVAAVASSAAAVAVAVAGGGVWALVTRQLVNQGLITCLALVAVRDVWPPGSWRRSVRPVPRTGGAWFLLMAAASFVAYTLDSLIVGSLVDLDQLGLYSMAITLAFAPLTRVSWVIGGILFPAIAATKDRDQVRRLLLTSTRLMALILCPLVPVAVVLAPVLIPTVLGDRWTGMVRPFQILLIVGVAHAVLNVLGETFSGSGQARFRAQIDAWWAVGTVAAVVVLTSRYGIEGAAVAHLLLFAALAVAYLTAGLRRIGLSPTRFFAALGGVLRCICGQTVVIAGVHAAMRLAGTSGRTAAIAAGLAGVATGAGLLFAFERRGLLEVRQVVAAAQRPTAREHAGSLTSE